MKVRVGQGVLVLGTFEPASVDSDGAVTYERGDPDAVTLTVTDPANVETTYTWALGQITRAGIGVFHRTVVPTAPGRWECVMVGTGDAPGVIFMAFDAEA